MRRLSLLVLAACALYGCARGSATGPQDATTQGSPPRGYTVSCDAESCPSAVGLFVGSKDSEAEPMHCTAVLVGDSTVVTAGHCVDLDTRACDGAWLGFPPMESGTKEATSLEWVRCKRVQYLQVPRVYSEVAQRGKPVGDAAYLEPDYAVIEIERPLSQPPIEVSGEQPSSGDIVRMVSLRADRFYKNAHAVFERRCRINDAALATAPGRTVRALSECPIRVGDSGAPLLTAAGDLLGIVHAGKPPFLAVGVMTALRNQHDCPKPKPKLRAKCTGSISHF